MVYAPQMGAERNVVADPTMNTLYNPNKESNVLGSVEELSGKGGKDSSKKQLKPRQKEFEKCSVLDVDPQIDMFQRKANESM